MSIKRLIAATVVCAVSVGIAFGQTAKFPFPQKVTYLNGYQPTSGLDSAKTASWYNQWKTQFLRECSGKGTMPTADDPNQVKVEGVGWALIAAAYMGDKATFDGIYSFYKANLTNQAGGMMSWKTTCDGVHSDKGSAGSATDGDLDVAFGLVVAGWQWPNASEGYMDEAVKVITTTEKLITSCGDVLVLAAGYDGSPYGGGCNYTDLSYYFPAYFRVFAEVSGKSIWNRLADDTYVHLQRNAHATTGLVSGWQDPATGAPSAGASGNFDEDSYYNHDASRVPWRIALDYLWYGTTAAKDWATKITNWAASGVNGASTTLVEGYQIDGTPVSGKSSAGFAFMGAWAVGAMANSDAAVREKFWTYAASRSNTSNENYWYHSHLGNMYLLTLSGNMWFVNDGYRIMAEPDGGGTVRRSPNKSRYATGERVTLTAEHNTGWEFMGWAGASTSSEPSIEIVVGSADVSLTAKFELSADGVNLVNDGNFERPLGEAWTFHQWDNTQGSAVISNNEAIITINTLGSQPHNLQLVQSSLPLLKGNTYKVTFDAFAAAPRDIQLTIQMVNDPWDGYLPEPAPGEDDVSIFPLTTTKQPFELTFTMEHDSDPAARIGFNVGQSTETVRISNVSVIYVKNPSSVSGRNDQRPVARGNLPMASVSGRTLTVNESPDTKVRIRIINMSGKIVAKHNVRGGSSVRLRKLPAGAYVIEAKRVRDGVKTTSRIMLR